MIRRGLIVALACVAPGAAAAQNVAEVQVAPPTVTIRVGERTGLLATAFDRIGNVIPTVRIIWSSNNVNVAKVDNSGTVTGVANGVAFDDGHAVGDPGDRAAVIDLRHVDVVGRPDDADGGDDITDAVERRGEQTGAFPDADRHRWRGHLDFGDVLRRRCARRDARERDDESASYHGWRMCVRLNAVVKPTCHNRPQRRGPKTR